MSAKKMLLACLPLLLAVGSVDATVVALKRSPGLTDGQGLSSSISSTIANGTITVYSGQGSVADTFIYNNTGWAVDQCYENSGAAPIVSQQGLIVLAKFGLSQLPGFAGGTVNKAQLRFYCPGGNSGVSNTGYITSSDWSEGNKVGPGLWGYPGNWPGLAPAAPGASGAHPNGLNAAQYQNADGTSGTGLPASWANNQVFSPSKDGVSSGSFVSQTSINNYTGLYVTLDITAMVQLWANGTPNYGLYIGNCGNYSLYMSEETGSADYQPILFIDYLRRGEPDAITNLAVVNPDWSTLDLTWTAPSANPPATLASYDIRYSTSPITDDASFNAAAKSRGLIPVPAAPGTTEHATVPGLSPATTYYFAIKGYDQQGQISPLSNAASGTTLARPTTAPAPITTLASGVVTKSSVQLNWMATGDEGSVGTASRYDLRYSTNPITDMTSFSAATAVSGLPTPQAAGSVETFTITGLSVSTTYYFAIVAWNEAMNCCGLSNVVMVSTSANTLPVPVADLRVAAGGLTNSSVQLNWTATGDAGTVGTAGRYDLRYSTGTISDMASFNAAAPVLGQPAPQAAGSAESFTVTGLSPSTAYTFALVVYDTADQPSGLSNVVAATTSADAPPAAVADLASPASGRLHNSIRLTWTATGNDGSVGTASRYDLRYSTAAISDMTSFDAATPVTGLPAPKVAPSAGTFTVTGLNPGTAYNFALVVYDSINQASGLSNVVVASTCADTPPTAVTNLSAPTGGVSFYRIQLTWTASGEDGSVGTASRYDLRYSTGTISDMASFNAATQVTGVPAPKAAGSTETFTVTGLTMNTTYNFALVVYDAANQASGLSNVAVARTLQSGGAVMPVLVQSIDRSSLPVPNPNPSWNTTGTYLTYAQGMAAWNEWLHVISMPNGYYLWFQRDLATGQLKFHGALEADRHNVQPISQSGFYRIQMDVRPLANGTTELYSQLALEVPLQEQRCLWFNSDSATGSMTQDGVHGNGWIQNAEWGWPWPNNDGQYGYIYQAWNPNRSRIYKAWVNSIQWVDFQADGTPVAGGTSPLQNPWRDSTLLGGRPMMSILISPDGKYAWVTVMPANGSWQVDTYTINQATGAATYASTLTITGWNGIRLLAVSPSAPYLLMAVTTDMSGSGSQTEGIVTLREDPATGALSVAATSTDSRIFGLFHIPWGPGTLKLNTDGLSGYFTASTLPPVYNYSEGASSALFPFGVDPATGVLTIYNGTPGTGLGFELDTQNGYLYYGHNPINVYRVPASDIVPPAALTDLAAPAAHIGRNSMQLTWTATGNDGMVGIAGGYDLRYSTSPITDMTSFNAATRVADMPGPSMSGQTETFTISGLAGSTTYYFAIVVYDSAGNASGLSNVVSATTVLDTAPAAIADLAAVPDSIKRTSLQLTWTATGEDGPYGTASCYDLRYSTSPIVSVADFDAATQVAGVPAPQSAGSKETFMVTDLSGYTTYYFAMIAYDATNHYSGLSNVATATTRKIGDIDGDGQVNLADLKLLVAAWNTEGNGLYGSWNPDADLDGDNYVNLSDLKILVAHWNQ